MVERQTDRAETIIRDYFMKGASPLEISVSQYRVNHSENGIELKTGCAAVQSNSTIINHRL